MRVGLMVQVRCGDNTGDLFYTDCEHKGGIAYAGWLGARLKIAGIRAALDKRVSQVAESLTDYATIAGSGIYDYVDALHEAEDLLKTIEWPGVDLRDGRGEILLTCHAGDWLFEDDTTGDVWSIGDNGLYHTAYDALFDRYTAAGTWADAALAELPNPVRASLKEAAHTQGDPPPIGAPKSAAVRLTFRTTPANEVFEELIDTLYDALAEAKLRNTSITFVPIGE